MVRSRRLVAIVAAPTFGLACHSRGHADLDASAAASTTANVAPSVVTSGASNARESGDPLAGLLDDARPAIKDADKNAVFDPEYVVVGDAFYVAAGSVDARCKPRGDWAPAGIVSFLGEELIAPTFPTPLRSYHAYYRATAKGDATLELACTEASRARTVAKRALKVLDASDAAPFVAIEGEDADVLAPTYEQGRAGALACFTAEFARDPHVRGSASIRVWVDKRGVIAIPHDSSDDTKNFRGISPTMIDCVRLALTKAAAAQKHVDLTRDSFTLEHGVNAEARMRFEVRPKLVDLKTCDRYADHWKKCGNQIREGSRFNDPHAAILTRQKVVTTNDGRVALAFACEDAIRDLDEACGL